VEPKKTIPGFKRMENPFSFKAWIDENRHLLKPPVGNKVVFKDSSFIVMVVGGPNSRTDFHVNQTDEFFYQIEGDIFLRIINKEQNFEEIHIKEGEVFLLPAGVPHSPQRSAKSIGLVIEKTRTEGEEDGLQWYCTKCTTKLYEEYFHLTNIETQFGAVFNRYYNSEHVKCKCGHVNGKEW
jgi:3-hydroxyanthranilate 3,4-dioxygenase